VLASIAVVAGSYGLSLLHVGSSAGSAPVGGVGQVGAQPIPAAGGPGSALVADEGLQTIDHNITPWTANLARNPKDFISATYLGELYEARGRLTGNLDDYLRAKTATEQAMAALTGDLDAAVIHARLLQTLHDFSGALAEAQSILKQDPTSMQALATEGDAELELGNVQGATAAFDSLEQQAPGAPVTARLSRLAFINGDTTTAIALSKRAWDEATAAGETGATLGWYAYLAGTVSLQNGSPVDAATWYGNANAVWPDSFLVLGGLARAQAAQGQTSQAIATYQEAIAIAPQPDTLTLLGDLYALNGQPQVAAQQYATVAAIGQIAAVDQQVYNRQLALFDVNHDRNLDAALQMATAELTVRKDVYGYDAYAWALLANGRLTDAETAIQQALAFGTKDALLEYHAGMISAAVGDASRARTFLQQALAIPGGLDPLAASKAAAELTTLP
jgi:tetratricopeptide (TPR) repeat protein